MGRDKVALGQKGPLNLELVLLVESLFFRVIFLMSHSLKLGATGLASMFGKRLKLLGINFSFNGHLSPKIKMLFV